jgi:hypothetical protein
MSDVQDTIQVKELKTEKTLPETGAYSVTNPPGSDDRALDCNGEAGALAVADVLGTLIKDLQAKGIIE